MRVLLSGSLAVALLVAPLALLAGPSDLYESIEDVELGPVFMRPDQRQRLEARRGIVEEEGGGEEAVAEGGAQPRPESRPAAGIIVSACGRALVWEDGDFRRADQASVDAMRFPGTVRIERFVEPTGDTSAEPSSAEPRPGSADEVEDAGVED